MVARILLARIQVIHPRLEGGPEYTVVLDGSGSDIGDLESCPAEDPIILNRGSTLEDATTEVHKDFTARLKFARVWGSGKHDGVMVKRDHVLQDGDIIELHM